MPNPRMRNEVEKYHDTILQCLDLGQARKISYAIVLPSVQGGFKCPDLDNSWPVDFDRPVAFGSYGPGRLDLKDAYLTRYICIVGTLPTSAFRIHP